MEDAAVTRTLGRREQHITENGSGGRGGYQGADGTHQHQGTFHDAFR